MSRSLLDYMAFRVGDLPREKADETPDDERERDLAFRKREKYVKRAYRKYPGRYKVAPGCCKWCGLQINDANGNIDRTKRFCGPICKTHHDLRADPAKMRRHVFFRDHGICDSCGYRHKHLNGAWELDHVLPLFIAYGRPEWWDDSNCVILCISPCHKEKTAEDRLKYRRKRKPLRYSDPIF